MEKLCCLLWMFFWLAIDSALSLNLLPVRDYFAPLIGSVFNVM